MKKIIAVFAFAAVLTACNNAGTSTENKTDSLDSVASEKKEAIDSSAEVRKDVIDSTTEQKKDAVKKLDSLNKRDSVKH